MSKFRGKNCVKSLFRGAFPGNGKLRLGFVFENSCVQHSYLSVPPPWEKADFEIEIRLQTDPMATRKKSCTQRLLWYFPTIKLALAIRLGFTINSISI